MKTLKVLLVTLFVISTAFAEKSLTNENGIQKEGITVPMKFSGATNPDYSSGLVACSCTNCPPDAPYIAHVKAGWTQGNQTHGGLLKTEQSTWEIISCNTDFGTMLNTSVIHGTNTVANGDSYNYNCIMTVNIITQAVILEINLVDGNGRFEGATGQITCSGSYNFANNVVTFSGEGYCTFQK